MARGEKRKLSIVAKTDKTELSMADLARMAGTSKSTVSRVLSNSGQIGEELRRRVMEVVRETGYVPDPAASALARGKGRTTGFLHHAVALVFCREWGGLHAQWHEVHEGILAEAAERRLTVPLCMVSVGDLTRPPIPANLKHVKADGLLVQPVDGIDYSALGKYAPVVVFGSMPFDGSFSMVGPDNRLGISFLVRHLAGLGHRKLEYVATDLKRFPFRERRSIFLETAAELNLQGSVAEPVRQATADYAASLASKRADERPTALVAAEDVTAWRLVRALRAQGLRVPQDVSVTGFDGRVFEDEDDLNLTTWRVPWRDLGRTAIRMLLERILDGMEANQTLMGGKLRIGDTTCSPRKEARQELPAEK